MVENIFCVLSNTLITIILNFWWKKSSEHNQRTLSKKCAIVCYYFDKKRHLENNLQIENENRPKIV